MQYTRFRWSPRFFLLGAMVLLLTVLTFSSVRARLHIVQHPTQPVVVVPTVVAPPPLDQKQRRTFLNLFIALLLVWLVTLSLLLAHIFPVKGIASVKSGVSVVQAKSGVPAQQEFQRGVIYPRWSTTAYGTADTVWQKGIQTMKAQTDAGWIEIPVLFSQRTSDSTTVQNSQSAPSVEAFTSGIRAAHKPGYHVFFVPLMQVQQPGGWSGSIQLSSSQQQQAWFDSYWHAIQPYVKAAADNGVEQMAIGTELQWLQQSVAFSLWNQLITRERSIFKNTLTYDINWSSLAQSLPGWLKNPELTMIGVSSYIPLLETAARPDPQAIPALWGAKVKSKLDTLASQLGKRVLITEIGYRNSTDALYRTWEATTNAAPDPQVQAAAYDATLSNVAKDPQIAGTFFWGWDDVGRFAIKNQPAVQILHKWYSQAQL